MPWNPAVLEQRIGRVYRLGQTEPVEVLNLVSEGGIESRIADLVSQKQAVFSTLFDGTSDEVLFDGDRSFLGGVKKLLEREQAAPEIPRAAEADAEDELEQLVAESASTYAPEASYAPEAAEEKSVRTRPDASTTNSDGFERNGSDVAGLLAGVSIRRTSDGGLRIDAPPALAAQLAQIFESLAASLRANTGGPR